MNCGYQIMMYDPRYDDCFRPAGLHNWFSTLEEAKKRKESLERTWSEYGVQYVIVWMDEEKARQTAWDRGTAERLREA